MNIKQQLLLVASLAMALPAAASSWQHSIAFEGLNAGFSGTTNKDAVNNLSFAYNTNYLERFGIGFNLRHTQLDTNNPKDSFTQDEYNIHLFQSFYSDAFAGKFTLAVNHQNIDGNASDPTLGEASTNSIAFRYMTFSKVFYADVHITEASYDTDVDMSQTNITLGFPLFSKKTWLQTRFYDIDLDNISGETSYQSTDVSLTYWLTTEKILGIDNWFVGGIIGERRLAYDPDSYTTWNLSDEQTDYIRAGVSWDLAADSKVSLLLGESSHTQQVNTVSNDYSNRFVYLSYNKTW